MAVDEFNTTELYGGAITVDLPATFADVSDIRQVPDNQEVYLDINGFTSIVFDILERVDKPDDEALDFHLQDVIGEDAHSCRIWNRGATKFSKLQPTIPAYSLVAVTPATGPQRNDANFVGLLFTMLRLEEQNTDIIITVNVPHDADQYDLENFEPDHAELDPLMRAAFQYRQKVFDTFEIKDWDLFVQE